MANGARQVQTGIVFRKGGIPWSKLHAKGMHLSPASEFKPGMRPANWRPIGTVKIRTHKGDLPRAWVKVANPNIWRLRAVVVWEATHGPLPAGRVVHHRDRDQLNDAPENLQALTRSAHNQEHSAELTASRRRARADRRATA